MILDEVRWAQIGCGDVTEIKSGPAFDRIAGSRRVIVASRNADRARDYATRHRMPAWTADGAAAMAHPGVNAVYIATPPETHLTYTRLAAAAGHAVLVEKPMARSVAEAEEMIAVCRTAGVPLFVAFYRRALPKFARINSLIASGAIGRPVGAVIKFRRPALAADLNREALPWRVQPAIAGPGGYFMDLAPHQLDLFDWFLGPVGTARGVGLNTAALYPAVDQVVGKFTFAGGVSGVGSWRFAGDQVVGRFASEGSVSGLGRWRLAGPKDAALDETEIIGEDGVISHATFDDSPVRLAARSGAAEFALPFPPHVHGPLIETVVAALLGRGDCPCTGECGLRTQRVLSGLLGLKEEPGKASVSG
jgi:1,5-anhydro-D-fructose reductase (1,5-anhydro-D-mannitol-forming)